MTKATITPSLWDFATAFYAKPAVQSACLTLQDTAGVNVPLLLCCCWVGKYYGELPHQLSVDMSQFTADYSLLTIEPLRKVRTTMKYSHNAQWPIKQKGWSELREQIKAIELTSEKLLLQGLEQLVKACVKDLPKKNVEYGDGRLITNCEKNILLCFESLDVNQEVAATLANVLEAVSVFRTA